MSATSRIGVVVMAYGTPAAPDDLEAYYTHIRRGRPPEPAQLDDLRRRYDAIGGTSSLAERTAAQVNAITSALQRLSPDRFVVELGQKHAAPFVEDAVDTLVASGVSAVVGVVLAPHYSRSSIGEYHRRAEAHLGHLPYVGIESWYDLPSFVAHQAAALRSALDSLAAAADEASPRPSATEVLFTAHSLPERALVDDPYPDQLHDGAGRIASAAGLDPRGAWSIAWQSAGRTADPWRGPDVGSVIVDRAESGGVAALVVVPHGFTSDHLEVAYDLDIEAADLARAHGLRFARAAVVNDDLSVMGELARRIATAADGVGSAS